ncbi:hypothetical protein AZ78_2166 [Lysobacter capsici AZ78]|uniref:Uncharacterized protein n=1 Tax=Lysobacter capsici AZ78 TaxID=1444315 RepID=A0A108U8Q0_9GAMM|nr:hypothetical protein AZ78_2166 [Lysobacter capsici AZ78]
MTARARRRSTAHCAARASAWANAARSGQARGLRRYRGIHRLTA